jgi:hypothetical protein
MLSVDVVPGVVKISQTHDADFSGVEPEQMGAFVQQSPPLEYSSVDTYAIVIADVVPIAPAAFVEGLNGLRRSWCRMP